MRLSTSLRLHKRFLSGGVGSNISVVIEQQGDWFLVLLLGTSEANVVIVLPAYAYYHDYTIFRRVRDTAKSNCHLQLSFWCTVFINLEVDSKMCPCLLDSAGLHGFLLEIWVFSGAFAKFRKTNISIVKSVLCPTAWNKSIPQDGFSWILVFEYFSKICQKIQVALKPGKNNGYLAWRHMYIYDNISPSSCN